MTPAPASTYPTGRGRVVRINRPGRVDLADTLGAHVSIVCVLTPPEEARQAEIWLVLGDERETPPLPLHRIRTLRFAEVARAVLDVAQLPPTGVLEVYVAGTDVWDVEPMT